MSTTERVRRTTATVRVPYQPLPPIAPPEPEDREPVVRATHVEVPALDDGEYEDLDPEPEAEYELPEPAPEPDSDLEPDADADLTPMGNRRSPVTESEDIEYRMPKLSFLKRSAGAQKLDTKGIERVGAQLVQALSHFNVEGRLIGTVSGPHVTRYELRLAPGIKMSKVATLKDDLAYALAADQVRILAPIPGKQAVGVEVPNRVRAMVHLGDVFQDPPKGWSPLSVWLGKDIAGKAIGTDLAKQPHILIAGTTGSGKSGCVNAMLSSVLLRSSPNEVRMVLVDPKRVELNHYEGIPHLLTPVVTSPRLAANVLSNLIKEMEERYGVMSRAKTRSLVELNRVRLRKGEAPLPYILCVIDELADLMMVAPADVEDSIIRLAQKSRAVGIHLVLATQRPSADVITGMIKANVPARIAFAVSSQTDSRVILDQNGAESLLGQGDMLFRPAGESRTARIQGAFIAEEEIERLTEHWRRQGEPELQEELLEAVESEDSGDGPDGDFDPDQDDLLGDAIATVVQMGTASTSMLQRRLRVGYTRAGRLIDMMERRGVISGYEGSKARQVLITEADLPRVLEALSEPAVAGPGRGVGHSGKIGRRCRALAKRCGKPGCASGSTSPTSRRGRRSGRSTFERSRTRSSGCCPGRRSSRPSCGRTRRCSGSTRTCWSRNTGRTTSGTKSSTFSRSGRPRSPAVTGATGLGSGLARWPCSRWWRSSGSSWRSASRATTMVTTARRSARRPQRSAPPLSRRRSRRRPGGSRSASSRRRPRTSAWTAAPERRWCSRTRSKSRRRSAAGGCA